MSKIEFIYFNIHGGVRGLVNRLVLKFGDVDYTETVVEFPEWAALKPKMILGSLPVAKIDGVEYCQAAALVKYFSQIGSMAKLSSMEELKSNMVHQTVTDVFIDGIAKPSFAAIADLAMEQKTEKFHETARNQTKDKMAALEKVLNHFSAENGVVPGKICVGDLSVLCLYIMAVYLKMEDDFKAAAPTTMKLTEHLMSNDKIKKLVEEAHSRKFFPF